MRPRISWSPSRGFVTCGIKRIFLSLLSRIYLRNSVEISSMLVPFAEYSPTRELMLKPSVFGFTLKLSLTFLSISRVKAGSGNSTRFLLASLFFNASYVKDSLATIRSKVFKSLILSSERSSSPIEQPQRTVFLPSFFNSRLKAAAM